MGLKAIRKLGHFLWVNVPRVIAALHSVSAVSIFTLMLLMVIDAAIRKSFAKVLPFGWQLEITLIVLIGAFGFARTQAMKQHINVLVLAPFMNKKLQMALDAFSCVLGFLIFVLIVWQAWLWAVYSWRVNEFYHGVVKLPIYPAKFGFMLGAAALCIQFLLDFLHLLRSPTKTREEVPR